MNEQHNGNHEEQRNDGRQGEHGHNESKRDNGKHRGHRKTAEWLITIAALVLTGLLIFVVLPKFGTGGGTRSADASAQLTTAEQTQIEADPSRTDEETPLITFEPTKAPRAKTTPPTQSDLPEPEQEREGFDMPTTDRQRVDGVDYMIMDSQARADISDLKSAIQLNTGNIIIPMSNGYIDTSGTYANINTVTPSDVFKHGIYPCKSGDVFVVNGQGGTTPRTWAFIRANDGYVISRSAGSALCENVYLIAPNTSGYIVINDKLNVDSYAGGFLIDRINTENLKQDYLYNNFNHSILDFHGMFKKGRIVYNADGWNYVYDTDTSISIIQGKFVELFEGDLIYTDTGCSLKIGWLDDDGDYQTYSSAAFVTFQESSPYIVEEHGLFCFEMKKTDTSTISDIDELAGKLHIISVEYPRTEKEKPLLISVFPGDISGNGIDQDGISRCNTKFIQVNGKTMVTVSTPYQFVVYKYNAKKQYVARVSDNWARSIVFDHTGYIRLKIQSTVHSSDVSGETKDIANALKIYTGGNFENASIQNYNHENLTVGQILSHKICISDTSMLCASAPEIIMHEETGWAYVVYLSSRTDYGEQRERVILTKFSVANPNDRYHYNVAISGETIDSVNIYNPYEPNIMLVGNNAVITFYNGNDNQYYARMFSIVDGQLKSTLTKLTLSYNGSTYDFNDNNVATIASALNATFTDYAIFTCRIEKYDGNYYGTITSKAGNAILCKSTDCITWSIIGKMPGAAEFEEQIAIVSGTMYALGRNDTVLYKSTDLGETWSTERSDISAFQTRHQLFSYKNQLLEIIPLNEHAYGDINNSDRTTVLFRLNGYDQFIIQSRYGIVYPAVFKVHNDLYIVFSNNQLFRGITASSWLKDALFSAYIGEIWYNRDYQYFA